jgi:hypothetical protein
VAAHELLQSPRIVAGHREELHPEFASRGPTKLGQFDRDRRAFGLQRNGEADVSMVSHGPLAFDGTAAERQVIDKTFPVDLVRGKLGGTAAGNAMVFPGFTHLMSPWD